MLEYVAQQKCGIMRWLAEDGKAVIVDSRPSQDRSNEVRMKPYHVRGLCKTSSDTVDA